MWKVDVNRIFKIGNLPVQQFPVGLISWVLNKTHMNVKTKDSTTI